MPEGEATLIGIVVPRSTDPPVIRHQLLPSPTRPDRCTVHRAFYQLSLLPILYSNGGEKFFSFFFSFLFSIEHREREDIYWKISLLRFRFSLFLHVHPIIHRANLDRKARATLYPKGNQLLIVKKYELEEG